MQFTQALVALILAGSVAASPQVVDANKTKTLTATTTATETDVEVKTKTKTKLSPVVCGHAFQHLRGRV